MCSSDLWYIANREAGYNMLYLGITVAVTAIATRLLASKNGLSNNIFNSVNLVIFVLELLTAIIRSFLTLNQL